MALPDMLSQGVQKPTTLLDSYLERAAGYRKEQMAQRELEMRQQDLESQLKYRGAQMENMQLEQGYKQEDRQLEATERQLWDKWWEESKTITDPKQRKDFYQRGYDMALKNGKSQIAITIQKELENLSPNNGLSLKDTPTSFQEWKLGAGAGKTYAEYKEWLQTSSKAASTRKMSTADMKLTTAFVDEELSKDADLVGISDEDRSSLAIDIASRADELYSQNTDWSRRQAENAAYDEIKQQRTATTPGQPPANVMGFDIPFTGSDPETQVAPRSRGGNAPAQQSQANEVERLVNGKVAIFDANTKEFIRWK